MTCEVFQSGGLTAIVCSRGGRSRKCVACNRPASRLCDWKVKSKKSGTCDRPLCATCTHQPAEDKDLCPDHAAEWRARLASQAPAQP